MCLFSKTDKALVATEDIPVYKILRVNEYGINRDKKPFFTPLFGMRVAVPSTLRCRGKVSVTEREELGGTVFAIGKGMIHCYPCDKREVLKSSMLSSVTVVAFGYIPKGTPYYEQLDGEKCLCANKIRLGRIAAQSDELALTDYLPNVPPLSQWIDLKES